MQLEHQFTVPASPDVVWAAVVDPARVAPCMPGATLTEVNGSEFTGSVKVKLGPVSLLYKGTGQFVEIDEQSRRVVIKASGKDSRGNGTASATVTLTLRPEGEQTHGTVQTDLAITGKPAQFGRGMISEVGGKILDTFANCLAGKLGDGAGYGNSASGQSADSQQQAAPKPTPRRRSTATSKAASSRTAAAKAKTDKPGDTAAATGTTARTTAQKPATPGKSTAAAKPRSNAPTSANTADKAGPATNADKAPADRAPADKAGQTSPDKSAKAVAAAKPTNGAINSVTARTEPEQKPQQKAGESAQPNLRVVAEAEPETEAIDLLDYAGPSVLKRVVPLVVGVVVLVLLIRWLRHR